MQFFNNNVASRNWIGFYIFVILGWLLNLYMSFGVNELNSLTAFYGADFWERMCRTPSGIFDWPGLFFMWGLMGAAMMAPTLYPALQTYNDLIYSGGAPWVGGATCSPYTTRDTLPRRWSLGIVLDCRTVQLR